jgi:hypothetical protein
MFKRKETVEEITKTVRTFYRPSSFSIDFERRGGPILSYVEEQVKQVNDGEPERVSTRTISEQVGAHNAEDTFQVTFNGNPVNLRYMDLADVLQGLYLHLAEQQDAAGE